MPLSPYDCYILLINLCLSVCGVLGGLLTVYIVIETVSVQCKHVIVRCVLPFPLNQDF